MLAGISKHRWVFYAKVDQDKSILSACRVLKLLTIICLNSVVC